MKKIVLIVIIISAFSQLLLAQEFRSSTAVTSASQAVTVDLSKVATVDGASITIRNSSGTSISLPEITNGDTVLPLTSAAIVSKFPVVATDEERAMQAWQFVLDHMYHYCYAGSKTSVTYDPVSVLNGFGFGCCEQSGYVLAWIWQQQGYQVRLGVILAFHTIPEIYYGGSWHMFDPDHRVIYRNDNGTVASIEQIIGKPDLVARMADKNGRDPVGYLASDMANLYALAGPSLRYAPPVPPRPLSTITLRPFESLSLRSENLQDTAQFYSNGSYLSPSSVNSAEFSWDLSFGNSYALRLAYAGSGIKVASDSYGAKVLVNTSNSPGYIVYQEFSPFPVLGASVAAQLGADSQGSVKAWFSIDGIHWPGVVPFQSALGQSSFDQSADLTVPAAGFYSYFVKIELDGGVQLHRLRINSQVQTAKNIFPTLTAGALNQLTYQDSSPSTQSRALSVTTVIPAGKHQIKGVRAQSLMTESPTYSISRDNGTPNLVDGDPDSLAYPGGTHLDYLIQLNGSYHVNGIAIDWGYFGTDQRYAKNWQLLARAGNQPWQTVAAGGFPGAATLNVDVDTSATELRIVADGIYWIGVYDIRVFGTATPPSFPINPLSARSNVPESPTYSLALNYGAASLVDGDIKSLAYPGLTKLDYSISLPSATPLTSALITWGYYGITPGYVESWTLLGRNGADQPWTTLAQGGFPSSDTSVVNIALTATEVRLVASSSKNWIGVYEVALYSPVPGPVSGVSAISNVHEVGGSPTSNLADGDDFSVAAPGNTSIDYTLDPGQTTFVDSARLVWGTFGTDPRGINSWRLLGLPSNSSTWQVVARGFSPNTNETTVLVRNKYRKLRVAADGATPLGMNEVQLFGARMTLNDSFTVKSNISESAAALALHYGAMSLIDGDVTSLAYPGGPHLDYQVSLGASTQLNKAVIDWGVYGINSIYVNKWSLLGRTGPDQPWLNLAAGGFPNSGVTTVALNSTVTDVRIVADGSSWIGIYELQLK